MQGNEQYSALPENVTGRLTVPLDPDREFYLSLENSLTIYPDSTNINKFLASKFGKQRAYGPQWISSLANKPEEFELASDYLPGAEPDHT